MQPAPPAKRPGGLTALAILNFVFGGFNFIGGVVMALFSLLFSAGAAAVSNSPSADPNLKAEVAKVAATGTGILWLVTLVCLVVCGMLIVSGVGYLKMKKFVYTIGNAYAIVGIVYTVLGLAFMGTTVFGAIIGIAYPVVTLALLNTKFKKCFT
jgi:hypothetical protein